jgi:putative copper export protein
VGIIMAMIAGFFRMIGLREEARKRYMDACMGMVQVLSAPAVLGIIALIVRSVLKLFPGYVG